MSLSSVEHINVESIMFKYILRDKQYMYIYMNHRGGAMGGGGGRG